MTFTEHVPLAPLTTLGIGGSARWLAECENEQDLHEAITFARKKDLPFAVLGGGSNTLIPDEGFPGLVVKALIQEVIFEDKGDSVEIESGAGVSWDLLVRMVAERALWGFENLAGIPGTVGGAVVQNIGAYGAELSQIFLWADAYDTHTLFPLRLMKEDAHLAYRSSIFKDQKDYIVLRARFRVVRTGEPSLSYPDVLRLKESGAPLGTPSEVGDAIRSIRAKKFPPRGGSAGSFFKNLFVSSAEAHALVQKFPGLTIFPLPGGRVKIPLAWILDHVLNLRGYTKGRAHLFENQPLVIVADEGATTADVDALAEDVVARVYEATGIKIEREVEKLSAR